MKPYTLLVVCTDNLCRSPVAEAVIRHRAADFGLAGRIMVSSAATHDLNVGEPADLRAQKHALRRELDLSAFRARLLEAADFERCDLLLAVDESTMLLLRMRCPENHRDKLHYLTQYARRTDALDIPDPYYGQAQDFERMLDTLEDAADGLLSQLQQQLEAD